jgi:hypothetical protein
MMGAKYQEQCRRRKEGPSTKNARIWKSGMSSGTFLTHAKFKL